MYGSCMARSRQSNGCLPSYRACTNSAITPSTILQALPLLLSKREKISFRWHKAIDIVYATLYTEKDRKTELRHYALIIRTRSEPRGG